MKTQGEIEAAVCEGMSRFELNPATWQTTQVELAPATGVAVQDGPGRSNGIVASQISTAPR